MQHSRWRRACLALLFREDRIGNPSIEIVGAQNPENLVPQNEMHFQVVLLAHARLGGKRLSSSRRVVPPDIS
jgi:hypothetical protein